MRPSNMTHLSGMFSIFSSLLRDGAHTAKLCVMSPLGLTWQRKMSLSILLATECIPSRCAAVPTLYKFPVQYMLTPFEVLYVHMARCFKQYFSVLSESLYA